MKATIGAIGDEIVGGLTIDTNSGYLSQLLRSVGVEVETFFAVPDDADRIHGALRRALSEADLVVTTGGLGPTADDLTTACAAAVAGAPLELHEASLHAIRKRFRDRGLEMPENNRKQALFPRGATVIPNPDGTAPGFVVEANVGGRTTHLVSLPGVPREMRRMAEETLVPWVAARSGGGRLGSRIFSTFGLSESRLDELLAGGIDPSEARLSFRAAFPRLQVRVSVSAPTDAEVEERLDLLEARVRERLGTSIYAVGDEGLEETVGGLLRRRGETLALAESCTGGLIGHRLTDVPGSSEYLILGIVAYSNEAKRSLLGVSPETLRRRGAVSEETVLEMARGARLTAGTDWGLATSGIAGPGGGTEEKPVGTVCIAAVGGGGEWSHRFQLGSRSRAWVKEMTAQLALDQLRRLLLEVE